MSAAPSTGACDESPESRVKSDIIPLVHPHFIPKSSKDPNRGLYSKPKRGSHKLVKEAKQFCAGPSFNKASELYNNRLNMNDSSRLNRNPVDDRLNYSPHVFPISLRALGRPYVPTEAAFRFSFSCEDATVPQRVVGIPASELVPKRKKQKTDNDVPPKNSILNYFKVTKSDCAPPVQTASSKSEPVHEVTTPTSVYNYDTVQCPSSGSMPYACSDAAKHPSLDAIEYSNFCAIEDLSPSDMEDLMKEAEVPYAAERDEAYYFGLFGATEKCEQEGAGVNYFEWLPVAVMEQILCQVPFPDLVNLRLVCRTWNEIICEKKFIEWKKAYYRFKIEHESEECFSIALTAFSKIDVTDCFHLLLRFMTYGFSRRAGSKMMNLLQAVPMFKEAQSVLLERFTEWTVDTLSPWCVMTMLVILSETVWDICKILKSLIYSGSPCSVHDVLDAFYCIATFLLHFKHEYKVNHGLHYRVYYALCLFENAIPKNLTSDSGVKIEPSTSGQMSMHNYCHPVEQRLTYEQIRFLNHRLCSDQIVKVVAFAGTGKTTTLIHYARLYPRLKFLNVMFNKAVCEHAKKVFPPNVECRTAHSLAYQAVGRNYRHKLCFKLKAHDLVPHLNKPKSMSMHIYSYAKYVLQTINHFMASADEIITTAHVPEAAQTQCHRSVHSTITISTVHLTDEERLTVADEAAEMWKKMIDRQNTQVKVVHDFYLKLYQLSHPVFCDYDCIMIDEAQDSNAAMLDIMLSQDLPVILVGDPNQQIYSFRGANNALQSVEATHTYHLTKSFRFGPEIAYIASCCIEILKCNSRDTLVGSDKQSFTDGTVMGQYAVIARSNNQLFEEAVRLCCTSVRRQNEPEKICGAYAGGITGYGLDQLVDIHRLSVGGDELKNIKDRFIKKFKSYEDLCIYAKNAEDTDLQGKLELVKQYGSKIIDYVRTIKKKCCHPLELANVVFSTAHKSKGLEFDTVCITNDYKVGSIPCERPTPTSPLGEEYNVLYVALTRAKKCLLLSETLHKVLLLAQEKFEYPVSAASLLKKNTSLKCANCTSTFVPHTVLVLYRRPTRMATGRVIDGGPLCLKCGTTPRFRPEIHRAQAIVFLDFVEDTGHRSMYKIVGPLPSDPPIVYDDIMMQDDDAQEIIFQVDHFLLRRLQQ